MFLCIIIVIQRRNMIQKHYNETKNKLSKINLDTVMKLIEDANIEVLLGDSSESIAFYEKEDRIIYVNRKFYHTNIAHADLQYVLLHEYYHSLENLNSNFPFDEEERNIEDADIFTSALFIANKKHSKYSIKLT